MRYFRVHNFDQFQHYKDRSPVWIKFYNDILDNYEHATLPDASKAHLHAIWLLASRSKNKIPFDPKWVAQRIGATEKVNLEMLLDAGFIEMCDDNFAEKSTSTNNRSKLLAEPEQSDSPEKRREETETEKKDSLSGREAATPTAGNGTDLETTGPPDIPEYLDRRKYPPDFERVWQDWRYHKTPKGSKYNALLEWKRHVVKAGIDPGTVYDQSQRYCEQCLRTDTSTKHVERWIKKRGWEDDYGPGPPSTAQMVDAALVETARRRDEEDRTQGEREDEQQCIEDRYS